MFLILYFLNIIVAIITFIVFLVYKSIPTQETDLEKLSSSR